MMYTFSFSMEDDKSSSWYQRIWDFIKRMLARLRDFILRRKKPSDLYAGWKKLTAALNSDEFKTYGDRENLIKRVEEKLTNRNMYHAAALNFDQFFDHSTWLAPLSRRMEISAGELEQNIWLAKGDTKAIVVAKDLIKDGEAKLKGLLSVKIPFDIKRSIDKGVWFADLDKEAARFPKTLMDPDDLDSAMKNKEPSAEQIKAFGKARWQDAVKTYYSILLLGWKLADVFQHIQTAQIAQGRVIETILRDELKAAVARASKAKKSLSKIQSLL